MNRYYYLVSSLPPLFLSQEGQSMTVPEFLSFCQENMNEGDWDHLKKIFYFNDIRNAVHYRKGGDPYQTPAYFEEEEFLANLHDSDEALLPPFLKRYFSNRETSARDYVELSEIDELAAIFFEEIGGIGNRFLQDYFLFELDLRNLTTALSLRKQGLPYREKLIPGGRFYEALIQSENADFGIGSEADYFRNLSETVDSAESVEIENVLDKVRWDWLSEYQERDEFSGDSVSIYALKLSILSRWAELRPEKGRELFDKLVSMIKRSVKFSIEILTVGDKKQ